MAKATFYSRHRFPKRRVWLTTRPTRRPCATAIHTHTHICIYYTNFRYNNDNNDNDDDDDDDRPVLFTLCVSPPSTVLFNEGSRHTPVILFIVVLFCFFDFFSVPLVFMFYTHDRIPVANGWYEACGCLIRISWCFLRWTFILNERNFTTLIETFQIYNTQSVILYNSIFSKGSAVEIFCLNICIYPSYTAIQRRNDRW